MTMLPGDWDSDEPVGDVTPLYGMSGVELSTLWLPETQYPHFPMDGPGKREDGKLWFEGPSKLHKAPSAESEEHVDHKAAVRARPHADCLRPRDYRRGDRWLPWHHEKSRMEPTREDPNEGCPPVNETYRSPEVGAVHGRSEGRSRHPA